MTEGSSTNTSQCAANVGHVTGEIPSPRGGAPEPGTGLLATDRWGSGPTLVLLHPLGADRQVWRPVADALGAERECIAVDLPGFGESPSLTGTVDPRALATMMAAELDRLAPDGYHVAGNSLGGWVALELALAGHARTVTAIAAAGLWPHPLGPKPQVARKLSKALSPLLPLILASAAGRRAVLAGTMAHPERVPKDEAVALVRAYADAPGFAEVNAAMRAGVFSDLAQIEVPVTLAWPEHDRLVARPRRLPPSTRNITLHDCGHIPMWDDPDAVAQAVLEGSSR